MAILLSQTTGLDEPDVTVGPSQILAMSVEQATVENLDDVRRCAATFLRFWDVDEEYVDAVELCVSELFTNVVTHVPGSPCTVALRLTKALLRLTVRDCGLIVPEVPQDPQQQMLNDLSSECGRGLCMVTLYAQRFYFERLMSRFGQGKTAVAEWAVVA